MSVDWEKFNSHVDSAIESGAQRTDAKLASKISSITRMTDDEVKEYFPAPADAKKLAELLKVVNDATDHNTKIKNMVSNAEEFAGVILTLLKKFVL